MEDFNFTDLEQLPISDNSIVGITPSMSPIDRWGTYSHEEFEYFILERARVFLKKGYHVLKRGGAGDKGIDVLVSDQAGHHIIYQCKKYSSRFKLSDTLTEIGKICYYSYIGRIPKPMEYYLVAYSDLADDTIKFFNNKSKISEILIENWDQRCKNKITTTQSIKLDKELENYIKLFNFSSFSYKGISEILEEHKETVYFAFRFGGELTIHRPINTVPSEIQLLESKYISKLFEVYSEELGMDVLNESQLKKYDMKLYDNFQTQRERFFSAENLRLFAKDSMLLENEFDKLKNEIYDAIVDSLYKRNISAYEKLDECLTKAANVAVTDNLLTKCGIVGSIDRKGVCHHLANERDNVKWKN